MKKREEEARNRGDIEMGAQEIGLEEGEKRKKKKVEGEKMVKISLYKN